jgi:hypothetical protein
MRIVCVARQLPRFSTETVINSLLLKPSFGVFSGIAKDFCMYR